MEDYKELEYKYNADDIKLSVFQELAVQLNPERRLDVSSWDTYFTEGGSSDTHKFIRFRDAEEPELTIKRKTKSSNNWNRVEVDLPVDPVRITEAIATKWVDLLGYEKNFKIYKSCFIYWYECVNLVYYVVYNEEMVEQGRYVEVEVNKEKVAELGEEKALEVLNEYEKKLEYLGIYHKHRLKRSLFEIHKK